MPEIFDYFRAHEDATLAFQSLTRVTKSYLPFSAFFQCISYVHAASGLFRGAWSSWHFQLVSLHLKPWTSLPASFAFCSILDLASERTWRQKPPAERNALFESTINMSSTEHHVSIPARVVKHEGITYQLVVRQTVPERGRVS